MVSADATPRLRGKTLRRTAAEVREALLQATIDELGHVGSTKASLRSIARRVGISHQAVTYHFADQSALFTAVATQGFIKLAHQSRAAMDAVSPRKRKLGREVAAFGEAYIVFARNNPAQFTVMFGSDLVNRHDPVLLEAQIALWKLHYDTVAIATGKGWGGGVDTTALAFSTWSLSHGMATLECRLPSGMPANRLPEDILHTVLDAVITDGPRSRRVTIHRRSKRRELALSEIRVGGHPPSS
nr:TetR/AcrR family transcriptional regulator [Mycobacteroides salmoniphilum]